MAEWQRVVSTTLTRYLRGEENNIMRKRRLTALLKQNGCITYNWSGKEIERRVRYRQSPMSGYADLDAITFARQQRWKQASLDWRGYVVSDMLSEKEKLMNKGSEAIIKITSEIGESMKEEIQDQFAEQYYIDGNASGNEKKMHGIASFLATGGSVTVANGYKPPSDTFAGLLTDLGNYGGSWSGSWPDGSGSVEYDFWSPILLDYTDADAWSAGATWAANCEQVLRHGIAAAQRAGTKDGQLDFVLTDRAMFVNFVTKLASVERVVFNAGQKSQLAELGFKDTINFDGTDVTWEYGVTASRAFGFNTNRMETRSLQGQLFEAKTDYDPITKSELFTTTFWGNTWWNPKYFIEWRNHS